jgi:pimeloyl-ACP methyl ester carboxylesterase
MIRSGPVRLLVVALFFAAILLASAGCTAPSGAPPAPVAATPSAPSQDCNCPSLIFTDPEFAFELTRTLAAAYAGEADIGECLTTASRIRDGDFESWYTEWKKTADHFRAAGDESLKAGHTVTARDAYYRAATYYRTAEFFLHGNPADPRIVETWGMSRTAFRDALALDTVPHEIVAIPYGNTTLPGYFYNVDSSDKARPLLIVQTGFDGCQEELHPYALEGLKRGYNVLTFEGPGQGEVIRMQHLPFRADWENVIIPIIDYAAGRPDVDPDRIALWGISLGGYLAPRGTAYEPRIAALIADGGVFDVGETFRAGMKKTGGLVPDMTTAELQAWLRSDPAAFNAMMQQAMAENTGTRWMTEHGMFVFNASSPALFYAGYMDMTLEGSAEKIRCPTLVTAGAADPFDPGAVQARALYDHLTCEKDLLVFPDRFGAGTHCQLGAFAQSFAAKFDWLDQAMNRTR